MSKQYTCLGLMSGTSGDGVDASIISSDGQEKILIMKNKYYEYDNNLYSSYHSLKKKINTFKDLESFSEEIKNLENKITIFHAKVVKDISFNSKIDLLGFHGQTIYHNPKEKISKQLGNGTLLAQLTNNKVVFNFRKNDILNGGEGAPLTPIFHLQILKFKNISFPACVLNIGGISNLTVAQDSNFDNLLSRDIGPGNCLVDQWMQSNLNKKYDEGGKISARGKINEIILEQALETHENIFQDKSTRSFDTNDFDISFIRGLSLEDGAATLVAYTAKIISSGISFMTKDLARQNIKILLCGGGRKNNFLIDQIKHYTKGNFALQSTEKFNLNGDFIESQAFAYLAIRSFLSLPISFPNTTGCNAPCTGGEIIQN